MSKYTAFVLIIALRLIFHPSHATTTPAFSNPAVQTSHVSIFPASLISFNGTVLNNKVTLSWAVSENESADLFEIEKSTDGKIFTMTALVFGSDKPATASYQFYEKAGNQRVLYRIKLINKDKKAEYSPVVEINPNA